MLYEVITCAARRAAVPGAELRRPWVTPGSKGGLYRLHFKGFNNVTGLDVVVVFQTDPAFVIGGHFFHVVPEPSEGTLV